MSDNPSLSDTLAQWPFDPTIVLGVALGALVYMLGLRELARRGKLARLVAPWRIGSFAAGLVCVVAALQSPVDTLSDKLFFVHMVQHMLLLAFAPPLLLLGKPIPVLLLGLPHGLVRSVARAHARQAWFHGLTRALTSVWLSWLLYNGVTVAWHLPGPYQAALDYPGVHLFEHLSYLIVGMLFWWVVIEPAPGPPRLAFGWRLVYLLAAMIPGTVLGSIYVVASTPVYAFYARLPRLWGISAMDDQGLAGNIMWLMGDGAFFIAAIPLFVAMMERLERHQQAGFDAEIAESREAGATGHAP